MARRRRRRKSSPFESIFLWIISALIVVALIAQTLRSLAKDGVWVVFIWIAAAAVVAASAWFGIRIYRAVRQTFRRHATFRPFYSAGIDTLVSMDPFEFEKFIGHMYERKGYLVRLTPERGDNGIDLVLYQGGKRYAVQVKKYAPGHPVEAREVRDFFGSFATAGYVGGFFITTSGYTRAVSEWVGTRPITLIDGVELLFQLSGAAELPWYRLLLSRALRAPYVYAPPKATKTPAVEPAHARFWKNL